MDQIKAEQPQSGGVVCSVCVCACIAVKGGPPGHGAPAHVPMGGWQGPFCGLQSAGCL